MFFVRDTLQIKFETYRLIISCMTQMTYSWGCKRVLHNYTKLKQRRSFNNLISNSSIAKNNIYKSYKE